MREFFVALSPMKIILTFFLPAFLTLTTTAQSVDSIFAKYIDFLGGKQRLQSVQTRIDSGAYNYGGLEFPFVSYALAPDRYKYVVTFKGKYFAQAFDGKEGWKIDVFKNEKQKTLLKGDMAKAMANEADVKLESPFIDYKQKGCAASLEGTDTVGGRLCHCIKLQFPNNSTALYCFDQQTGALLEKIALSKNAELNNAILQTFYTDYTNVNGLNIPFKTTNKIKDQTVLVITLKGVALNPPISAAIFKP